MKNKINLLKEAIQAVPNAWRNFVELVEAISLLTVSIYSGWAAYFYYELDSVHTHLLLVASIIILLVGMKYAAQHFNKKG
jgi:TRAP-type C4-dicarboxylate transport system permease small subunit